VSRRVDEDLDCAFVNFGLVDEEGAHGDLMRGFE